MADACVFRLTDSNIKEKANQIVLILQDYSKKSPCNKKILVEETSLTTGQISRVIKYMRRCSEKDFSRFIKYYPISSKKGYFLPKSWDDFLDCYISLSSWCESLTRTIQPMKNQLEIAGYDQITIEKIKEAYKNNDIDNYLEDIPEMNKNSSWFTEEDD